MIFMIKVFYRDWVGAQVHRGGEEARLVSSWSSLLDYWTTCRLIFFWASWPLVYYWRARLTSFCLISVSSPKNSLFNNCSSSSHTFHMLSSAPSSNIREGTCSSPLPTSKQPSPHFSHFFFPLRHHRTRAFLEFQLAPFSFDASASIRPASEISIVFK